MNSIISQGRTIEQAIENALEELGVTQDQVTIKVISEGGLFKKAKVEVTIDKDNTISEKVEEEVKEEKKPETKKKEIKVLVDDESSEERVKPMNKKGQKEFVSANVKEEKADKEVKQERNSVNDKAAQKIIETFLNEFLKFSKGENISIKMTFDDKAIYVSIDGNKLGGLIGNGGENLNNLESYLNVYASKHEIRKRIRVDVGNYKQERVNKLERMAEKAYQMAIKSGSYKFEAMPARDRRIIHTTLQNKEDVTTYSKGTEPKRFVIVEKKSN